MFLLYFQPSRILSFNRCRYAMGLQCEKCKDPDVRVVYWSCRSQLDNTTENVRDLCWVNCFLGKAIGFLLLAIFFSFGTNALALGGAEQNSSWSYSGWVCDPVVPGYQGEVQARRGDGVFLGRMIADRPTTVAVPAACRSPHGVHGFQLDIEQKPEWADGKTYDVTLYSMGQKGNSTPFHTFAASFSAVSDTIEPPRQPGDIVGRDLDSKYLGAAGHIGVWDGSMVIEALDESGSSKIFKNTWNNFKSRTKAWDTVHPRYPVHFIKTCWDIVCDINQNERSGFWASPQQAVFYRATQVFRIGADYTWDMGISTAEPAMRDYKEPRWKRDKVRGSYRCDTFVYDAFRASTDLNIAGIFPYREVSKMHPSWSEKVSSLIGYRTFTPAKVMEKIRSF